MAGPTRYVLDTHFYVDVLRGAADEAETRRFLAAYFIDVDVHAFVGAELVLGASGPAEVTAIRQRIVDPSKPGRLLVPDAADLLAAGDVMRTLRSHHGDHPEHARRNFWNDVIIATSCRRCGRVLISRDRDHERIAAVVGHQVISALPV